MIGGRGSCFTGDHLWNVRSPVGRHRAGHRGALAAGRRGPRRWRRTGGGRGWRSRGPDVHLL